MILTGKRRDFIAKYLSDISKLFFAAGVVKQFFGETWNVYELVIGVLSSAVLFAVALGFQPAE